ncbi:DEMETER-like protein 2 isoform X3 [Pyrus x bretschneideri]|uniref:DEMETER-like protein 2 isoform X3 n=1 Tax=Pyrus x bretschneideri TaxID=225117 RepID=UPI00202E0205|nr:DEMETER-like protein 2 isoform X3 [Pyrus x bretschneideri]
MAELQVYQRREPVSRDNAMEEEAKEEVVQNRKQGLWVPQTPAKPATGRTQKSYFRRRFKSNSGQNNSVVVSDSQVELERSDGVSVFSAAATSSEENTCLIDPIEECPREEEKVQNLGGIGSTNLGSVGLFDLNKIVLECDEGCVSFSHGGSEDASQSCLEGLVAAEEVAANDGEILTVGEELVLQGIIVKPPISQSSTNATKRGLFEKINGCFIPVAQTRINEEKLQQGSAIPDGMSQCKSGDQQNQESVKQEDIIHRAENKNRTSNAANFMGGSKFPSTSSPSQKKKNLKRSPDGGIDLNEGPQKKPKKKVYRPKVVCIGRPRPIEPKTPKKATPKRPASKPKTPKPTTKMHVSSDKNMSAEKSSSSPKHLAPIEVTLGKVAFSVSDGATLDGDLKIKSNTENAIILATPPQKVRASQGALMNLSCRKNLGLNIPATCRKQRLARRRREEDCWSTIARYFLERERYLLKGLGDKNQGHASFQKTETTDLIGALQPLIMTRKKRSKGHTRGRNGGLVTEKWTNMGHSLNIELHNGECEGHPSKHEGPCSTNIRDSQEDNISPFVQKCPDISHGVNHDKDVHVPSNDHGILVPYKDKHSKRRPELSPTDLERVKSWKLQLQAKVNEGQEKESEEEWWTNEREVLHGRINLLMSRMNTIQGDRKFSPWKGSVVDSIVGVFLTQNVSDHLSSNAFMSLAARFPCQSHSNETDCEYTNMVVTQESVGSNILAIMPKSEEELHTGEVALSMDYRHKESSSDKPNDLEGSSTPLCDFHNPPEVSQIGFSEKVNQKGEKPDLNDQQSDMKFDKTTKAPRRRKNKKAIVKTKLSWGWCKSIFSTSRERNRNHMDSADWEAVRIAEVGQIAAAIKVRGQHNMIAGRIKKFLNQVHEDHKQIDLEWLRNAPPQLVTKYLREIEGIGLKSMECVRLLALQHVAFPVDVNVGRIAIRLGWAPLEPLPEQVQLHVLKQMPLLDTIQKYLWPRLKTLDPKTLYELHYQMITFGKVFCTKQKPNCNSCPMKGECRHYASAFASARLALPGPEKKPGSTKNGSSTDPLMMALQALNPPTVSSLEVSLDSKYQSKSCEPIIEEPSSPQPEYTETSLRDIEDLFLDDPNDMPTIKMRDERFSTILEPYTGVFQENDMATGLVPSRYANFQAPKSKDAFRLCTKHLVYVLPDYHPLLQTLENRDPDDPCPYLLAIWPSDEKRCDPQESRELSNIVEPSFSLNNHSQAASQMVRGTLLMPCRTATRGSFPLNGTYFQVNEIFADYETSIRPIEVPRSSLWSLARLTVYCGSSTSSILKGLQLNEIKDCFVKGFICVRAFNRKTRAPEELSDRFHVRPTKKGDKGGKGGKGGKKNKKEDEL